MSIPGVPEEQPRREGPRDELGEHQIDPRTVARIIDDRGIERVYVAPLGHGNSGPGGEL